MESKLKLQSIASLKVLCGSFSRSEHFFTITKSALYVAFDLWEILENLLDSFSKLG